MTDQLATIAGFPTTGDLAWPRNDVALRRRRASGAMVRGIADAAMLTVAALLTGVAGPDGLGGGWHAVTVVGTLIALLVAGAYGQGLRVDAWRELPRVLAATSVGMMATGALALAFPHAATAGDAIVVHWFAASALLVASRLTIHAAERASRSRAGHGSPTLIIGAGVIGHTVAKRLHDEPALGLTPVGFLDKDPLISAQERAVRDLPDLPVLGASWDLERVLADHAVERVVIAFSTAPTPVLLDLVRRCWRWGVEVTLVPRLFEVEGARMTVEHLGALPLVSVRTSDPRSWEFTVKYALDRVVAAIAIVVLAPLFAVVAAGVLVTMGRPILFRQRRVGLDGRVFDMLKFRTMAGRPDAAGESDADWAARTLGVAPEALTDRPMEDRRSALGRLLRMLSLDEIPQLWNVLRGDMSMIGPRPERAHYVEHFRDAVYRYPDRHRVKSGITGWAQVNGLRGETSLADRIEWDNFYIENWSPWLDLRIIMRTVAALFRGQ